MLFLFGLCIHMVYIHGVWIVINVEILLGIILNVRIRCCAIIMTHACMRARAEPLGSSANYWWTRKTLNVVLSKICFSRNFDGVFAAELVRSGETYLLQHNIVPVFREFRRFVPSNRLSPMKNRYSYLYMYRTMYTLKTLMWDPWL